MRNGIEEVEYLGDRGEDRGGRGEGRKDTG